MSVGIIGWALSLVTIQSRSIWSAVVIHGMYNILSGESQILHIDMEQNFPSIWTYTVNTENPLLTGINGAVGFTAALPAVVGFIVIIIMVKYYEKRKRKQQKRIEGRISSGIPFSDRCSDRDIYNFRKR